MDETVLISRPNKACCCCAEPRGHKGWLNYITGTNDPIRHLFCIVGTYFILARGNNQTHQCTTDKLFSYRLILLNTDKSNPPIPIYIQKSLKVFRLKAAILGLWFVNLVMFNCSSLFKTCLNVYSPISPAQWRPAPPSHTQRRLAVQPVPTSVY